MLRNTINKKGDGLSLNVIVIAVLALLVLIVLIYMFMKGTSTFSRGVSDCPASQCIADGQACQAGYAKIPSSCKVGDFQGQYCCTQIEATQ